jgi:hypothetical protein
MNKTLLAAAFSLASGLAADAQAAQDWFPGQTGQYHLIPDGQDVQNLTLFGEQNPACTSGLALFSVDENGKLDNVPFVVPGRTVFILTDALFTGSTNVAYPGETLVLNVAQPGPSNTYHKASFLSSKALQGSPGEHFAGSGSLQAGAAFATGAKLCAEITLNPWVYNGTTLNVNLFSVVVHGKVIDNYRTTTWPYLSW